MLSPSGSVRNNSLGTEGWCAVFAALRDNKDNKIESWDLSEQGINVEIAKVLAEYVSASTALKSLKCAARMLPCPVLSAAADTLIDTSACRLNNNQLCGLDLDGDGTYTAEGIIKLSDALKVNATLTSLRCASSPA